MTQWPNVMAFPCWGHLVMDSTFSHHTASKPQGFSFEGGRGVAVGGYRGFLTQPENDTLTNHNPGTLHATHTHTIAPPPKPHNPQPV